LGYEVTTFDQVSVDIKANIYFEGKVTSRTIVFSDGSKKTLGIMLPGEYHFNTDAPELMEITQGTVEYRLTENDAWIKVNAGSEFNVPGNSAFDIRALDVADYCCSFL
jgi:purine/pyrimidine-nucleoside phosphorylase